MKKWPVQATYYNDITARCADYIRKQAPGKYIAAITISWADWNTGFTEEDKNNLVELSKKVDSILDQGHHGQYIKQAERKAFIERLHCKFGTSGGFWVYPPFRCHRQRWFLPVHQEDGHAYQGAVCRRRPHDPLLPGSDYQSGRGGEHRVWRKDHVGRQPEGGRCFGGGPRGTCTSLKRRRRLKKLVETFQLAEDAYFSNMDYDADGIHLKSMTGLSGARRAAHRIRNRIGRWHICRSRLPAGAQSY